MKNIDMTNPAEIVAAIPVFKLVDEEVDKFYKLLHDKDIEPKSLEDLERIIKFFDSTTDTVIDALNKSESLPPEFKKPVIARFTIDMYGRIAENFGLDFMQVPMYLGKHNKGRFFEAQKNLI